MVDPGFLSTELKMLAERKEVSLRITPTEIAAFTTALKEKLLCGDASFAKHYLRMLVDEIRVNGNEMNITGSKVVLIERLVEMKKGTESVPSFMGDWRPEDESNVRPTP